MPGSVAASALVIGPVVHRPGPTPTDAVANATVNATSVKMLLLPPISNLPVTKRVTASRVNEHARTLARRPDPAMPARYLESLFHGEPDWSRAQPARGRSPIA